MFLSRKWISYIPQYFQRLSMRKKCLLISLFCVFICYTLLLNQKSQLCDPTEHLWWYCPWPDPQKTVCSWDTHFPLIPTQIRSPESSHQFLSTLSPVRPLFQYNNQTLIQCNEHSIDLLIFVISKCSHSSIRQSIRRTWGNIHLLEEFFPQIRLKLLFLVDIDSKSGKKVELEYLLHKDIVQIENLPEQYEYVTEREAGLYQFIRFNCKQTKYLFKTDDDIFINTFLLLLFVNNKKNSLKKYSLIGFPIKYGLVIRHTDNSIGQRYIITKDEYSCSRYPTFLSGFGYLMSFESLTLLSQAYFIDTKPFPLSDVYFTGLLSQLFHIQRQIFFPNLDYRYQRKCTEAFFLGESHSLACAASDDHFNGKQSNDDRNLMNDYNLYWTILIERYNSLRINLEK